METNETILSREIVSIDDRKRLGKIKELCVDCETLAVSHYIVGSATTNASLVLPFNKSLAVGDTFMTVQSRDDFIPASDGEAKSVIDEAYRLVGVEVFSQNGNRIGVVEGFEYDPTHGKVTKINLGKRLAFTSDTFVFFAPDFVFVDDGASTAYEIRNGIKNTKAKKKTTSAAASPRIFSKGASKAAAPAIEVPAAAVAAPAAPAADVKEKVVIDAAPVVVETIDEDAVLKDFLINSVVSENVESKDGLFKVAKGTKLTKELVDEAQKHDSLLLLTMSVEA
ncbi:MAG: hypothetical protein FWG24_05665 [Eggerthellaceae bacterium]|nr:hypothetical protein [Eggerthellaceae bacterium]